MEARTNHFMIERAQRVIAAIDSSKIGLVTLAKMVDLADIQVLVTDSGVTEEQVRHIRAAGVEVHVVDVPAPTAGQLSGCDRSLREALRAYEVKALVATSALG